jgi:hypothetical protein
MYNHYGVTTLDDLIEKINMEKNNPDYDGSYLDRLKKVLIDIRSKYGNICVVAATFPMKGNSKWEERNIKFAKYFENKMRLITKSKEYYLISEVIKVNDGDLILIVGKPDGLRLRNKGYNADIYEVKSFDLDGFYATSESKKDEDFIKRLFNRIKIISNQLIVYQYLLEGTINHGLIGKVRNINLYGKIYLYSEDIENLHDAKRIIGQNIKEITIGVVKYNAHNFILNNKEETTRINDEEIYYSNINFRVRYNPKAIKIYFNDLNKLLKSSKPVDNGSL